MQIVLLQIGQADPVRHLDEPVKCLLLLAVQLVHFRNLQYGFTMIVPGQEEINNIRNIVNNSIFV